MFSFGLFFIRENFIPRSIYGFNRVLEMSEEHDIEAFETFFSQRYEGAINAAVAKGMKSFEVDFKDLDKFNPQLADKLLNNPSSTLELARKAIQRMDIISNIDSSEGQIELEPRFKNLPEQACVRIRNIRAQHIGKFVCVEGIVRRASEVRPEISKIIYYCQDCGAKIEVKQKENIITAPESCKCGRRGKFDEIGKELFDSKTIVLEELYEVVSGEKLGEIRVYLKGDLTTPEMQRKTDPGNKLKITGIVREIKKFTKGRMRRDMDIFIEANHVEPAEIEWEEINITPEDEKKIKELAKDPMIFDKLVKSIAPSIYGMDEIKQAIALQMFGGVKHIMPDNTRIRGDIHILLLGDPSSGKSQLLKLVASIIPRGKYVSGHGTSAAGLTATVVKDEEFMGGWVLEAGAMVLANKSTLCIDEFDKMSREDQIAMHESLEQQTISIAKASIVATLPAQVSVLAGANPKFSRFDRYKSIGEQIDIPQTLLSRFDLKFALFDEPDRIKDEKLATHIMETRLNPQKAEPIISPDLLRKYIAYTRKNCFPEMKKEAIERLKTFYIEMRSMYSGSKDAVPITLRQNESLMRLAEASAKIRLSKTVEVEDAERAISIMKASMQQLGYDVETGKYDVDKLEGGMPTSQRNKINLILAIIEDLEKEHGKQVPIEEITIEAEDQGITRSESQTLLNRLQQEGMIFFPKHNVVQRV